MNFDRDNELLLQVVRVLQEDFPTCDKSRFLEIAKRVVAFIESCDAQRTELHRE